MRIAICFLLGAIGLWAQPKVTAVAQGADFSTTLAPGTLATVFGTGFAASPVSASAVPLSTSLGNVSVNVNGRVAAPILMYFLGVPGFLCIRAWLFFFKGR